MSRGWQEVPVDLKLKTISKSGIPEAIAKAAHFKLEQPAPIAPVEELADYHAIVVG